MSSPSTAHMVTAEAAAAILAERYGITATAEPLAGEHDANFCITTPEGTYVLKISAPDAPVAVLDLQHQAIAHIREVDPSLPIQRVVPTRTGEEVALVTMGDGSVRPVRLLTWLSGTVWADWSQRPSALFASLGALVARVDRALSTFGHAEMNRAYLWGMQYAGRHREFLPLIGDPARRAAASEILDRFDEHVRGRLARCRAQVIHNDASDRNILVGPDGSVVGLIDFGDLLHAPLVSGLAVACAYAMLGEIRPIDAVLPLVAAYHEVTPLADLELELLFDLIRTRLAMSQCMAAWQTTNAPDNEYLLISQSHVWDLLRDLRLANPHLAHFRFRDACGLPPNPTACKVVHWIESCSRDFASVTRHDLTEASKLFFDLSTGSPDSNALEALPDVAAAADYLFARMRDEGATVGIGRYLEDRPWYRAPAFAVPGSSERRSVHLGVDLFLDAGEPIFAPLDGVVYAMANNARDGDYGPVIMLQHATDDGVPFWTLYGHLSVESLDRIETGRSVERGRQIGRIGNFPSNGNWAPHLHFQLLTHTLDAGCAIDGVAPPSMLDVWESISPDPNLVLGIPEGCRARVDRRRDDLLRQRHRYLSDSLSLSYTTPLRIVRGEGQFLFDDVGRAYLDMVNNVCHVGHAHPRVVRAGQEQMARLNTNTRYLYDPLVEYVRRLVETFPDPLRVCFLVNSGSEANDLALRLAQAHTGRRGVIVIDHAYHGHLSSLVEISPYKFDGPGGSGCPPHVRVCEMPDGYRGSFRYAEPEFGLRYGADVGRKARELEAAGIGLAAFFAESAISCGGQIVLPPGYLAEAYRLVRAAGGLCVADEVQVGLGRVGTHMWAFETQGVVPDIVTMGKPLGNGHPLAAVMTTSEVAASFETGMEYFNTFGGNPVSCAIGLAVLDVIRDERLQQNALQMGDLLMTGLHDLSQRCSSIGDVRGLGLFIGVELVENRTTLEPAAALAKTVIERGKENGILLSIDGPHHNVLKIKPPMGMTEDHVGMFLDALERALDSSR